jgi:hypothetical protein
MIWSRRNVVKLLSGISATTVANLLSDAQDAGYTNVVEVIPLADLKILPRGKKVQQATNLMGEKLGVTIERGNTVITVPRLEQYDLISVQLA